MTSPARLDTGQHMHDLIARLFPIARSITGVGVAQTLNILQEYIPLHIQSLPTGQQILDWQVPNQWDIKAAYIQDPNGNRIIDWASNNLHVMSYSTPINATLSLEELKPHLFSLPDQPDLIPYRTSYYKSNWGFCLPHHQLQSLQPGQYKVVIDSTLQPGQLQLGELVLPGQSTDEIILSAHCCHPSLANDNLAGIAVLIRLAQHYISQPHQYTLRFIVAPGTIGAIAFLATHADVIPRIKHGLIIACAGDPGDINYKQSRRGDSTIDRAFAHILNHSSPKHTIHPFWPYGYDERQYCSPGFNLPVGLFMRSCFGKFPQYHTSADNLDFVTPAAMDDSFNIIRDVLHLINNNRTYINKFPHGEPQLSRHGVYDTQPPMSRHETDALFWLLNYSDGNHDLLTIAEKSNLPFSTILSTAHRLQQCSLL